MSETTPVTGSAEMADEPSMEDILASIRKIIADDEPVAEPSVAETSIAQTTSPSPALAADPSSELEAPLNTPETLQPSMAEQASVSTASSDLPADASFADHMSAISETDVVNVSTDFDAELDGLMAELDIPLELDNTPVIAQPVSTLTNTTESVKTQSNELVDLDIEALLSEVDGTSEALIPRAEDQNLTVDSFDDDLDSLLDLEIPEMEEDAPIAEIETSNTAEPIEDVSAPSELSDSVDDHDVMALLDSLGAEVEQADISIESPAQTEATSTEASSLDDENLFDDLESLLTDRSDIAEAVDPSMQQEAASVVEGNQSETVLNAEDIPSADLLETPNADISESDLNALLDDLILEADDDLMSGLATPSFEAASEQTETIATPEALSLPEDGTDMSLVKSLMADLTEPEAEHSSDMHESSDTNAVIDDDGADALEALISDPVETVSEGDVDLSTLLEEDPIAPSAETVEMIEEDTENVLDDILNMTLDDEFEAHEGDLDALLEIPEADPDPVTNAQSEFTDNTPTLESVLADEAENKAAAEPVTFEDTSKGPSVQEPEKSSILADIARDAEQDADDVDALIEALESEELPESTMDSLDAALDDMAMGSIQTIEITNSDAKTPDMTVAEGPKEDIVSTETVSAATDTDTKITTNAEAAKTKSPKETADMPKAALNTDAILDEVTEEASVSAFASLNSIVEENAIREERGDRIGDLVMEALRPMLKEWLDANLKGIVERAVTKEVKRISSGK